MRRDEHDMHGFRRWTQWLTPRLTRWLTRWMSHRQRSRVVWAVGLCLMAVSVHAQSVAGNAYSSLPSFVQSDSERAELGTTLTGPEATPGACLAAIQVIRTEQIRHPYQDTLPWLQRVVGDTLPTASRTIGAICRTQFPIATVPVRELENLFLLAGHLGDTADATAALTRWLTTPQLPMTDRNETPVQTRAKRLDAAVHGYLDTTGIGHFTDAAAIQVTSLLRQLDALGPSTRLWQLDAHLSAVLATIAASADAGHWDAGTILPAVLDVLARSDSVTPADRPDIWDKVNLIMQALQARGFLDPHGVSAFYDSLRKASSTVAETNNTLGVILRIQVQSLQKAGMPLPPLAGTYWYNTHGATVWPTPGRVSLLLAVEQIDGPNLATLAMFKRLAMQYGPRGLDIAVVTKTQGYWLHSGTQTGPIPSQQEAVEDSAYYLDHLHWPFPLVVVPTSFTQDREHRLVQKEPVQFESAYGANAGSGSDQIVLADRTGHLLVSEISRFLNEASLTAYIVRVLGP